MLKQFLIVLAAVALALAAYEVYRLPQIEEERAQTEALRRQAGRLEDAAATLRRQVEDEHRAADESKQRYVTGSALIEGFSAAEAAKVTVTEFYQQNLRWPESNRDVGLQSAERYRGRSLVSLAVSAGGVVTLTYDAQSGVDGGTLQLRPNTGDSGFGVTWKCVTASYPQIALMLPRCAYQPLTTASSSSAG